MSIERSKKGIISKHKPFQARLPVSNKKMNFYNLVTDHFISTNIRKDADLVDQRPMNIKKAQSSEAIKKIRPEKKIRQKVAFLCWDCLLEGHNEVGSTHVVKLATMLAKDGHNIHIFTRGDKGKPVHQKIDGVHYHSIPIDSNIPLLIGASIFSNKVYELIKKIETRERPFNVIHSYNWQPTEAVKNLQNGIPRRIVCTFHMNGYNKEQNQNNNIDIQQDLLEQELIKTSDKILCFDQGVGKKIQNRLSLPEEKISVIQKEFHWEDYQWVKDPGEIKKKYDLWPLDPLVLFVGEFNNDYGPDILVDSIPALLNNHPNVRFLLVGDGELMWSIRIKAHYLLFEHAIRLVGHKEGRDLQELFQAADIVVIPNRITTSPYQVLAAWSSKKPVVATHAGSCGLIKHEENGVLVYDNPNSFVWGIERILCDWDKGHEIAQKGWGEIKENHTWDAICRKIITIYQS